MAEDPEAARRARSVMVEQQIKARGVTNPRVLEQMKAVPRHLFVLPGLESRAYHDTPLTIGYDQTISQPYMVAAMTQALDPRPADTVLEVGVGSGYQTAILAGLCEHVYGIERIRELADSARDRLASLGIRNVTIITGDGSMGYPPQAPYNAILVAAAGPRIPRPLVAQLADRGRLVIPVGEGEGQVLNLIWKRGGTVHIRRAFSVRFVPLIGDEGY